MRGYYGIGIENTKNELNVGGLLRSAQAFNADFIFTIGKRYSQQCTDTTKTWRHIPVFHWQDFDDFYTHIPFNCRLVGIELDDKARDLSRYTHPERGVYVLGAEDHGLSRQALTRVHDLVRISSSHCLNVAAAGSIVLYDRQSKLK